MTANADVAEKLLARSVATEGGCRRWTGAHVPKGYGQIRVNGKVRPVHVVAHELWVGPVPDGYDVDHVYAKGCRYRDCIEATHLEAVTHAENLRRRMVLITHCPKGHEYTPENIRWMPPRNPGEAKRRNCRRCYNNDRNARKLREGGQGRVVLSGRPPTPGVSYVPRVSSGKPWRAYFGRKYLGLFATEEQAAAARREAEAEAARD